MALQDLVDSTLSDLRLASNRLHLERVSVTPFLNEIAVAAGLHAGALGVQFSVQPGDPGWAVTVDRQLLAAAVTNLLSNAFKYTRPGGHVQLRARTNDDRHLLVEVEDECGGILDSEGDPLEWFGDGVRRGRDRTGLGRGLSIARKAVRAHGGDIHIRNVPDTGCIFIIDMSQRVEGVPVSPAGTDVSL
jgi:signal transduction histidine kinase